MNSRFPEFLAELKEKNDLVDVIGSYIKLEKRGYNYWACCPFHHEKTPSFSINAAEKYYHCFGCGASGDVIGFVKEYENVDFQQAVQILAARAKLDVPSFDNRSQEEILERRRKKERLLSLMKDAARFYLNNLYSGRAQEHLSYLFQRKLEPTTLKKFGIGASLDYYGLPKYLLDKGYSPQELEESGACIRTQEGKLLDAQGNRLIIPIINHLDEVVAFGGRLLQKTDRAKYKNTKDTLLFDKSKNLYNINLVKKLKRAGPISSLIMVEGYMDAMSLYQAGFQNVVASMGTSLTMEQARLCKRYSDQIFISYDGDFAGQKANLRGLEILKREGIKVRVVPLPEGCDPDDVIRSSGAEGYRNCLDHAMPLIDFRLHTAKKNYDLSRTDEKREFIKDALAIVREAAESASEREELLKRISMDTNVSVAALFRDLEDLPARNAEPSKSPPPPSEDVDSEKKAEQFILAACLFNKEYAKNCDLLKLRFQSDVHEKIADFILEERSANGKVVPGRIFDILPECNELSQILDLECGENLDGPHSEKYFSDCVAKLELRAIEEQILQLNSAYQSSENPEEKRELLILLNEQIKKQKKYK